MTAVQFFCNYYLSILPSSRQNGHLRWGRRGGRRSLRVAAARVKAEERKAGAGDHYATLNVSRRASLQEIKTAYRNLARKYHPDMNKNPGAEEKFKEISAAYEVLSDEEKRSFEDRYGQDDFTATDFGSQGIDPYEIFNSIFGESSNFFSSNLRQNQSLDISCDLLLTFEESIFGSKQEINVQRHETCASCNGSGAKRNGSIKHCTNCNGTGQKIHIQKTRFGTVSQISTC
ncbi:hypothetical protein LUZ60_016132 [Juncus effusus]|nr:hypothetical protein LUZ60_016132 [Juncus effusus]